MKCSTFKRSRAFLWWRPSGQAAKWCTWVKIVTMGKAVTTAYMGVTTPCASSDDWVIPEFDNEKACRGILYWIVLCHHPYLVSLNCHSAIPTSCYITSTRHMLELNFVIYPRATEVCRHGLLPLVHGYSYTRTMEGSLLGGYILNYYNFMLLSQAWFPTLYINKIA